jgi:hypothetical protein
VKPSTAVVIEPRARHHPALGVSPEGSVGSRGKESVPRLVRIESQCVGISCRSSHPTTVRLTPWSTPFATQSAGKIFANQIVSFPRTYRRCPCMFWGIEVGPERCIPPPPWIPGTHRLSRAKEEGHVVVVDILSNDHD